MSLKPLLWVLATVAALAAHPAAGREAGDPIRVAWIEGDVAGMTAILSPDGTSTIGFVDYRQHRRGSVIASWLLDLAAIALLKSPDLAKFAGRVSDSGEGRWTVMAAIDESVPAPVLSAALYERFSSRGEADFADKVLSALRYEFGGHEEKAAAKKAGT